MFNLSIKQKLSTYQHKAIVLYFFIPMLIASCNNTDMKEVLNQEETSELNSVEKDTPAIDTGKYQIIIPDSSMETPQKVFSKSQIKRELQLRLSEGVSDAKFNGEK